MRKTNIRRGRGMRRHVFGLGVPEDMTTKGEVAGGGIRLTKGNTRFLISPRDKKGGSVKVKLEKKEAF